jgi:phosphoglycolate phosphatase
MSAEVKFPANIPGAVFFDWDGTLVDTFPGIHKAHNHVRTQYGLPLWSEAEYREVMKYSSRDIYPKIYGEKAEEAMKILYDFIEANHISELKVMPQARELLEYLRRNGVTLGVVSNKRHKYLSREIEHLGWQDFFSAIVGAGEAEQDKPAAAPLVKAGDSAGKKVSDMWYVGDGETDLQMAKNAGCPAVLVLHGEKKEDLIGAYKPLLVANDCAHLRELSIK